MFRFIHSKMNKSLNTLKSLMGGGRREMRRQRGTMEMTRNNGIIGIWILENCKTYSNQEIKIKGDRWVDRVFLIIYDFHI